MEKLLTTRALPPSEVAERLRKAQELKDAGNAAFKSGDIAEALKQYHFASMYLKDLRAADAGQTTAIREASSALFNNLAACHVRRGTHARAVEFASKALELDPDNVKALFRRGASYRRLRDIDRARADLERAHALAPTDTAVCEELKALLAAFADYEAKAKRMAARMFGGGGGDDSNDNGGSK